jgi:ribosome maturation protein Sdo1
MQDKVINEINKFFTEQGFEESSINGKTVFKYKNRGYYLLSKGTEGDTDYYLEYAKTIQEAEKGLFEDIEPYEDTSDINSLIAEIKSDIIQVTAKERQKQINSLRANLT